MKLSQYNKLRKRVAKATGRKLPLVKFPKGKRMNRNESVFNRTILNGVGTYEPTKLGITKTNSRVYTPDFAYASPGCTVVFIEVKGSYKLGSEDRARLAWEISAEKYTEYDFVWARARKGGGYEVELWRNGGEEIIEDVVHNNSEFERLLK